MAATFWQFFGHNLAKMRNSQNPYSTFVKCQTRNVHSKFQVPSMFAVQMNVPFVSFQYCDLNVLRVLYLQANLDLKKIITQARSNIFSCGFLLLLHLNEIFENN